MDIKKALLVKSVRELLVLCYDLFCKIELNRKIKKPQTKNCQNSQNQLVKLCLWEIGAKLLETSLKEKKTCSKHIINDSNHDLVIFIFQAYVVH